ncbi:MAG: hypothetical protein ABSD74_13120 [Rhizomicrobium sp.]|jgi:hypothetical protein
MTGFRAESLWAAATGAALLIWPLAVAGQPTDSRPAQGPPVALAAGAQPPAAPSDAASTTGIQVRSLGTVDGPRLGLLDATNGGLGSDIWQDSQRERIEEMFKRLPLASTVPSIRGLSRRLILTKADAPSGDAGQAFTSVRLKALLDAGLIDDAAALAAKAVPKNDPELSRLVADALLFGGRLGDACGDATNMRLESSDGFWIKLRAFCYGASGDTAALDLTRAVMAAEKIDNKAFETLLDDFVSHRSAPPPHLTNPNSLEVALLVAAGLAVDPGWSERLGMPASVSALRDPKDPPAQRLDAAEDVVRAGALTTADLAAMCDAQTYSPDQLADAAATAPTLPFLAAQALIRQAVRSATDPGVKKKLLFEAMALAYGTNLLPVGAQLQGSAASAVIPNRADRSHAALMSTALMLSGRADAAARWYDTLDLNSEADKPLIRLMQVELDLVAPDAARDLEVKGALSWFAAEATAPQSAGDDAAKTNAYLVLGLYDSLGSGLPPGAQVAMTQLSAQQWQGRHPGAEVTKLLDVARSDSGGRGEAILAMLDFIGPEGTADVAPDAIIAFVRSLEALGYDHAARELAADAILLHHARVASSQASRP